MHKERDAAICDGFSCRHDRFRVGDRVEHRWNGAEFGAHGEDVGFELSAAVEDDGVTVLNHGGSDGEERVCMPFAGQRCEEKKGFGVAWRLLVCLGWICHV